MARAIGALCILIVALEILVGIPLSVCVAFFCLTNGPIMVDVHAGQGQAPQLIIHGATIPPPTSAISLTPPPNVIPVVPACASENPILASRAEHGSLLAGTVLAGSDAAEEERNFLAALEKAAVEHLRLPSLPTELSGCGTEIPTSESADPRVCDHTTCSTNARQEARQLIIGHLYQMAQIDEQAGEFERADQWRAFARDIRSSSSVADSQPSTEAE